MSEEGTITFKGVPYKVEDLSEKAKYFISQIQDLQGQTTTTRSKLDQFIVASKGFEDLLKEELEKEEND